MVMRRRPWSLLLGCLVLAGCRLGEIPDPNDPDQIHSVDLKMIQATLSDDYANLFSRQVKGEITEAQVHDLLVAEAKKYAAAIDVTQIDPDQAWQFGEILRTAEDWKKGAEVYKIATAAPVTVDRKVNDTLRYAQCLAHLGKVPEAIKLTRSVFNVRPEDKGPILPAVLYEIVPPAEKSGHARELAQLLVDACREHLAVRVDVETMPGRAFLTARFTHIRRAADEALRLARKTGSSSFVAQIQADVAQIIGR